MGICKDDLAPSLGRADEVFLLQPQHIPWQVAEVADACVVPAHWSGDVDALAEMILKTALPGDHILVMSNGGFGGIHQKLLDGLAKKPKRSQSNLRPSPVGEGVFSASISKSFQKNVSIRRALRAVILLYHSLSLLIRLLFLYRQGLCVS
jgi:hypothetical protein